MTLSLHSVSELVNIYNPRPLSPTFLIGGSNQSRDPASFLSPFPFCHPRRLSPTFLIGDPVTLKGSRVFSLPFVFGAASRVKARDMPHAANSPQLSSLSPSVIPDLIGDPGCLCLSSLS